MKRYLLTIVLVLVAANSYAFNFASFDFVGGNRKCTDLLPNPMFSPTSKAYGEKDTGTTTDQVFTLSNSGTAQLSAAELAVSGTSFSLQSTTCGSNPFDLAAGADCTATVRFAPLTAAEFTGSITMSAPNLDDLVASLSGTGIDTGPLVVSDDFGTTPNGPLSTNWTKIYGTGSGVIESNRPYMSVQGDGMFTWTGSSLPVDHFVRATIYSGIGYPSIICRGSSNGNAYTVLAAGGVARWVNGASTNVITGAGTYAAGDVMELTCTGTNPVVVTLYRNGTQVGTYSDSTASRLTTGLPGIKLYDAYGKTITTWSAGGI